MQRSIQAPMQEDKKNKIGINILTSQKLVNLFFLLYSIQKLVYICCIFKVNVLHILLHINTEYTYFGMRGGTDKQQVTGLYYYSNILIETSLLSLRY